MLFFSLFHELRPQNLIGSLPLPEPGFVRLPLDENSFGAWLRNLPLLPPGSPVLDYRKRIYKSSNDTTVAAVINLDIRGRRMEQCMDILIRLYGQFLWEKDRASELKLPLPGGYWLLWADWMQGIRPVFNGIDVTLKRTADQDNSYKQYSAYLRTVYAVSHTQQFYYWYEPILPEEIEVGDFFVLKGTKSHAVMVVDLAVGRGGQKYALIGHGDTPACEFHLLNYNKSRPWIPLDPHDSHLPLPIRRKMTWDGLRRFSAFRR